MILVSEKTDKTIFHCILKKLSIEAPGMLMV